MLEGVSYRGEGVGDYRRVGFGRTAKISGDFLSD